MTVVTKFERPVEILLAEDSPTDAHLTREALAACSTPHNLHHAVDGVEALAFLKREGKYAEMPVPDLVLLDLKMPRLDGHTLLAELKGNENLKHIPVIVLTTSDAESDVMQAYREHANGYVAKPMDFASFVEVMKSLEKFWFKSATLPSR